MNQDYFKEFFQAETCQETFRTFRKLCGASNLVYPPCKGDHLSFYNRFKTQIHTNFWKTRQLLDVLNLRFNRPEYFVADEEQSNDEETEEEEKEITKQRIAEKKSALIIGAGPCGLRTAIEMTLLGAKVIVVESRDEFTRNNVLHMWQFNVADLKSLGAKVFYPKLCVGGIAHIPIRRIQLLLLKTALIFGVEIHTNTSYVDLIPPQNTDVGWRAKFQPENTTLSSFKFDVIICANSRKDTFKEFAHKCFRAKLAIGITANFINKKTTAEAKIQETGGLASYGRPEFFKEVYQKFDIGLENFVYFKDETHYFVMCAMKDTLLKKKILKENLTKSKDLLSRKNLDHDELSKLMFNLASHATDNKINDLEFCTNHKDETDLAMFDFTAMYQAENSTMFREAHGHKLLMGLVGDSLLEPFWPTGTGCARGFLAAFDTTWMLKQWCVRTEKLDNYDGNEIEIRLLKEREATYKLLSQTSPGNICKPFENYTIDPDTRYPFVNMDAISINDVKRLYVNEEIP